MVSKQQLEFTENNEGYREFMYQCSAGKNTIAIGLNLEAGIPRDEALMLLEMRMKKIYNSLTDNLIWFKTLDEQRKIALADMAYQMGIHGLMGFSRSLGYMANRHYEAAADEFLDSRWAKQTPSRAKKVTDLIRG